jgi:tripartite-type tricarboxylate transporter receptor subunit TctC
MKTFKHWWLAAAAAFALGAQASEYPTRTIQVVVPFPPGAAADNAMRVIARRMSEQLKQPIVIENRPGVPGILAASKAVPDGYTLMLGAGSSIVTHPLMSSKLVYKPTDFVPVGRAIVNLPILTTHPSLGVRDARELIALAKKKPGRLDYSSSGAGSPGHLAMEMFQMMTGTHMVHIPYKGGAPAVTELMGGHVHLGINALPSVLSAVRQNKLVPLAVASRKRSPALPDVPTLAESGVPSFDYDIWYAMFAPARTPPAIVNTVSRALQAALKDPDVARQLTEQGAEPSPSTPQELADYIQRDTARWARVIQERKLKID